MLRYLSLSACILTLSACTTLSDMPVGTPLSQLQAEFGPPTVACPPQQPQRLVWSQQPYGQYAWGVDINAQQELLQSTQVLSDREFERLSEGDWTQQRVLCHFGPPAEKDYTPYQGVRMLVWSYRYKQSSTWNSLMYVYFGDDGLVKIHHPGPDPFMEPNESEFFAP